VFLRLSLCLSTGWILNFKNVADESCWIYWSGGICDYSKELISCENFASSSVNNDYNSYRGLWTTLARVCTLTRAFLVFSQCPKCVVIGAVSNVGLCTNNWRNTWRPLIVKPIIESLLTHLPTERIGL